MEYPKEIDVPLLPTVTMKYVPKATADALAEALDEISRLPSERQDEAGFIASNALKAYREDQT